MIISFIPVQIFSISIILALYLLEGQILLYLLDNYKLV